MIPHSIEKIARTRAYLDAKGKPDAKIEVDGNVSLQNAVQMRKAGANIFVAGTSGIFYGTDLADYFSSKYENLGDNLIIDAQEDSLSLKTPRHTILCSRQTPHRQIWLSSPVHGSLKFDFDNELDKWFEEKETSLEITKSLTKEIDMTIKSE